MTPPPRPPFRSTRLIDQVRERIRYAHYSIRTEESYVYWVRAYIRFHGLRHPRDMGAGELTQFLSHLAVARRVSASTHKQALCALLYLYREVLGLDVPWLDEIGRPKHTQRIPVVLSRDEVSRLLAAIDGPYALVSRLLYGCGLRLLEGLRLRVKDVDFDRHVIVVREGKGNKDRVVMLPASLRDPLRAQLAASRELWAHDRACQRPGVWMPDALDVKYPRAGQTWAWHWVWPSAVVSVDPRSGTERRHHLHESGVSRAIGLAVARAAIPKKVTAHTLLLVCHPHARKWRRHPPRAGVAGP
jgi:integron integrase